MESKYELKRGGRLGPGPKDAKEITVLNRVLRYTPRGLEYEADPRQCEKLLEEFGYESGVNKVATPGMKALIHQLEQDQELPVGEQSRFRGVAARANYLAADRPDIQFAAKEVCRSMSAPTEMALGALKRLCRYLVGARRLVYVYEWQESVQI